MPRLDSARRSRLFVVNARGCQTVPCQSGVKPPALQRCKAARFPVVSWGQSTQSPRPDHLSQSWPWLDEMSDRLQMAEKSSVEYDAPGPNDGCQCVKRSPIWTWLPAGYFVSCPPLLCGASRLPWQLAIVSPECSLDWRLCPRNAPRNAPECPSPECPECCRISERTLLEV